MVMVVLVVVVVVVVVVVWCGDTSSDVDAEVV